MTATQIIILSIFAYISAILTGVILALTKKRLDKNIKLVSQLLSENDLSFEDLNIDNLKCVNVDLTITTNQ